MAKNWKTDKNLFTVGVFLIAILILSSMGVLLFMGYSSQSLANRQSPQIRSLKQIKIEMITGHLWLEEILSGDRNENIQDVYNHFEKVDDYIQPLFYGGSLGNIHIFPIDDSAIKENINELIQLKDTLFILTELRFAELEKAQAGTEMDENYDAVFERFLQKSNAIEKALVVLQRKNVKRYNSTQTILKIGLFVLGILVLFVFIWLERYKSKKQKQLIFSNSKLLESEKRFRTIFNSVNDAIFVHDAKTGEIIDVNNKTLELYGYSFEEILKLDVGEISSGVPPYTHENALKKLNKALSGQPQIFEWQGKHKDGTVFWDEVNMQFAIIGGKERVLVTVRDTTERKITEISLKRTHDRLINILENMTDGFVSLDTNWVYTYVNKRAGEMFGSKPEDLVGKHIWTEFPEGIDQPFYKNYYKAAETQKQIVFEDYYQPWNRWYENRIIPSENGLAIFFQDITDRKLVSEAIKESEARLKEAQRIAKVGSWELNLITNKLSWSDEVYRLFDLEPQQFKATYDAFLDNIHPDDRDFVNNAYTESVKNKIPYNIDHRVLLKNGTLKYVHEYCETFYDEKGKSLKSVGTVQDITERKLAEDALLESQTLNSKILETSPDIIYVYDIVERKNVYSNSGITKVLGYSLEEIKVLGESLLPELMHPDDFKSYLENIIPRYQKAADEEIIEHEYRMKHNNGNWCTLLSKETIFLRDENGAPKQIFGITSDITKRKKAEIELEKHRNNLEELVKERTGELNESQNALLNLVDDLNKQSAKLANSNKQLSEMNEELETFTYSVSHDLKAPLRGIDGYSQLLLDSYNKNLNSEAKEFLGNIRKSTQQMNQLIEDLLSYSRMERKDFITESVHFKPLIDNLLLYYSKNINQQKVEVTIKFPEIFKPLANKDGMNLVMRNLIDNAIKFSSKKEKPKIEIEGSETETHWHIFVKDNGIGFDMKYHNRIFKIFQRLHLTEEYEGTGIGLAMVSKAMNRMNGKIRAESAPQKGACFYLEIKKGKVI